jgi:hypothetical protein
MTLQVACKPFQVVAIGILFGFGSGVGLILLETIASFFGIIVY